MEKHGFQLLTERQMKEIDGTARLWEHTVTKTQVLSIVNADENKCFGVSFRTPPADSTGVAHIMEHSVLCGSDRYPVKEPFVELLKGSLQTFLNAFTFPDKTCYPVASANLQDFYNLIDVYLDAVLHPKISEDIFRQEGWHLEAPSLEENWSFKGVVFNEMKGVYSSPDSLLSEKTQQALFPDMLYSLDSGGDPDRIPQLTYEKFRAFHETYYHPSNARFFFWGDDPEDRRLEILEEVLKGYSYRKVASEIPLQKPFTTPRLCEVPYAAGSPEQKAMFTTGWLLGERGDVYEALQMEMLEHILEGLPGSPLRRALISSGLGEDTTGGGLETDLRQMFYTTGLKGIDVRDVTRAETLIFDTLGELAEKGIEKSMVEAAVNSVEFTYRESNTGRFPRGLVAMIQALSTWLYDEDPIRVLAWEEPLQDIKNRLQNGEPLFENLIRQRFLENQHRSTVVLVPDCSLQQKRLEQEAARVAERRAALTPDEQAAMVEETRRLQEAQVTPDSPEALATIPTLGVRDLPAQNSIIPEEVEETLDGELVCLRHEQPTQGIGYASLLLPMDDIPEELIPLLPLFIRSLTEMGTARHDYASFGAYMAAKTGGVSAGMLAGTELGTRRPFRYFTVGGKAVYDKMDELFAILEEVLLEPLTDQERALERIGEMLRETRARLEEAIQMAGHVFVSTRLAARYSEAGTYAEYTSGVRYLEATRRHLAVFEKNPSELLEGLEALRSALVRRKTGIFSCTAEEAVLPGLCDRAKQLYAGLPERAENTGSPLQILKNLPQHEALLTPAQINYVGKSVNLYERGWTYHGSASVILRYLRMSYLWENVRVRGGAYGAFCTLDRAGGTLVFTSYRDPNTEATVAAYDAAADYLSSFTPDSAQLTQAIVGAVGDLDQYQLPSSKGATALGRRLAHDTDEARQKMREEMLATTAEDFRAFADVLRELAHGSVCILGGSDAGETARRNGWDITKLL